MKKADRFVLNALFASMTNVNFDENRYIEYLRECQDLLQDAKRYYQVISAKRGFKMLDLPSECDFKMNSSDVQSLKDQAMEFGIERRKQKFGDDYVGLQELIFYGLKGTAAYADHCKKK